MSARPRPDDEGRPCLRFRDARTDEASSTLAPLAARGRDLDLDALGAHLLLDVPRGKRTPYAGITHEADADAWDERAPTSVRRRRVDDAPSELARVLRRSVTRAFGDARRVAVLAGGGIDSASLAALACDVGRERGVSVFLVALDFASEGDDRPHLRALEAKLGCEVVRVSPARGAAHLGVLRGGVDALPPFWPFAAVNQAVYAAARENGAERVLTGAGGDHLLDGDPLAVATLLRRGRVLGALRLARRLEGFERPRSAAVTWGLRPLVARAAPVRLRRAFAHRRLSRRSLGPSWAGPRLRRVARVLAEEQVDRDLRPPAAVDVEGWLADPDRDHFLWLVHLEQQAGGLPRHDPFFTRAVADFALGLPAEALLAGDRRRGILREAMRGKVPDSLLDRPDKARFAGAFDVFARALPSDAWGDLLDGRELARHELVDAARFSREARAALASPTTDAWFGHAWAALSVEAFLRVRATEAR